MKKIAVNVMKTIGILLGGTMLGAALLVVAFLMPVNQTNKTASYEIIQKEGWYPAIPIVSASLDTYFHSNLPGVLDGSTDSIMLHTALETQEQNVLRAAMDMNDYDYYWHGYVSVLRPLLMLFDYGEIRTLNGFLQMLLILLLFLQVYRRKGLTFALLVPTSYFLLMSLAMPFSLQYSWVFYIAVVGALILTGKEIVDERSGMKLYWFFMVLGMCTSFFDLLTYPLFTWGFPLIWFLLFEKEGKSAFSYVKEVVFTGLWWILGYGGLWIAKWGLGSLILGRNIFESALYEVGFRLGAEKAGNFDFAERLEVLYNNWKHYEYKIYVLVLAAWLIYVVMGSIRNGVVNHAKSKALALIACSSVVWYMALANHTGGHHIFTYRIYGVAVLAVLAILVGSVRMPQSGTVEDAGRGGKYKTFVIWCVCGVLACGLSLLAREAVRVTNGDRAYREALIEEGENGKMRFTPAFPTIKEIGICVQTDAQDGACVIRVLDNDSVLYQEEIALSAYGEQTYAAIPVLWKLQKGQDYEMEIEFTGADKPCFLLVSENMDNPIGEYGELMAVEENWGGQILSTLSYSYRPLSKFTLAFLAMTWCGILFAGYSTFLAVKED